MKIISYCNHCHGIFDILPASWFKKYKTVIEHVVEEGEPTIYVDCMRSWIDELLKKLEDEELILTTECHRNAVAVYPLAINVIEFEGMEALEYYHVCKSFRNHEALLVDEKAEEE